MSLAEPFVAVWEMEAGAEWRHRTTLRARLARTVTQAKPGRHILVVGDEAAVTRAVADKAQSSDMLRSVSAVALRDADTLADDLALATATARLMRVDDVMILVPWSDRARLQACVDAFLTVPATLHLGIVDRVPTLEGPGLTHIAWPRSITLTRPPLSGAARFAKRCLDVVGAAGLLVVLAPLLMMIAALIAADGPGPIVFRQRRYGFNQQPFRIYKFRSMRVLEDGRAIRQASRDDPRVTRIGRVLRRFNLDELPQLINVLRGEMSLVGPRPHAMAHDQMFGRTIPLYARRHNVRPGITGWAQVSGHRGETPNAAAMAARVAHDLHYIDNWSFGLDLRILLRTVLSTKAYRNAH